ncbi:XdhC family protein [Paenibacillus tengchongensis]|uniref:XdhC family protein n=1 Tax=Paenibacillus tengchongensis TaxID=2608684 RepID=UPI00124D9150|nr:XdhC/CoxI family protein [Paenibacillus tengchongensis]
MSAQDIVRHVYENEAPAVLATLIAAEGHSYRKPGAAMLFYPGGRLGSLSPGCLEGDLELRTEEIWERGLPELVVYDMTSPDDFSWGEAVGCGGTITVVLEPVQGELRRLLREIHGELEQGGSLTLRREAAARSGYRYTLEPYAEEMLPRGAGGRTGCRPVPVEAAAPGLPAASAPLAAFRTHFVPKPRLILFGGGLDALPVAELAASSGFRLAVADWREGSPLLSYLPDAERAVCPPQEAAAKLRVTSADYVLILSHQSQRDRQFLLGVLPSSPQYIGIIGSQARIAQVLEGVEPPASLHAPVGLPIRAEGPEEIAVSIVAELIQIKRANAPELSKGVEPDENSRYLSGRRTEQPHGRPQGVAEAAREGLTRERRAQ